MHKMEPVNLDQAADAFLAAQDKDGLVRCMECSLSTEKFLECIYYTKRYDLLEHIEHALGSLRIIQTQKDLLHKIYLDLLILNSPSKQRMIDKKCEINRPYLCRLLVEKNVNVFSLAYDFSSHDFKCYFEYIISMDNLELFTQLEGAVVAKFSKKKIAELLLDVVVPYDKKTPNRTSKIMNYFCTQGNYELVVVDCVHRLGYNNTPGYMLFLNELCAKHDYRETISHSFSWDIAKQGKEAYMLMLSLGARPSEEQKQKLQTDNPRVYREIFSDDV